MVSGAIGLYLVNDRQFGERDGNLLLSIAIVVSVGLNALVSPILGAFSDRGGRRMPFLLFFTALCIATTFFIADVPPAIGLALFIVANFAYQAALIYYDATLKTVSYPASRGKLSGIGTGVGYCGTVFVGLLIFLLDIAVVDRFRLTAILFLVFAIPIFWFVREPRRPDEQPLTRKDITGAFGQLKRSIVDASEVPGLWRFLLGRFFYSDAVNTVIVVMSVVVVKTMGLSEATANVVLLMLTLVAIVMSFVLGLSRRPPRSEADARVGARVVGRRAGARRRGDRLRAVRAAGLPHRRRDPRSRASAASRSPTACCMVRLSPPDKIGEFFGIYGLVGKGSQVIGQLLYGAILFLLLDTLGNGAYQVAVLSLLVTMLIGLWLVWPVRDDWAGSGETRPRGAGRRPCPSVSPPAAPRSSPAEHRGRHAPAAPPSPGECFGRIATSYRTKHDHLGRAA